MTGGRKKGCRKTQVLLYIQMVKMWCGRISGTDSFHADSTQKSEAEFLPELEDPFSTLLLFSAFSIINRPINTQHTTFRTTITEIRMMFKVEQLLLGVLGVPLGHSKFLDRKESLPSMASQQTTSSGAGVAI